MKAFFGKIWAWVLANKVLAAIIAGGTAVVLAVAIAVPCGVSAAKKKKAAQEETQQQEPAHDHTYAEAWSHDATNHWHASTCGHDVKSGEAAHTFGAWTITAEKEERTCSVCGYKEQKNHVHSYPFKEFVWTETPGDYQAKAVYECSCGDVHQYDASVTPGSTEDATCLEDGVKHWNAQFKLDEEALIHEDNKDEVLHCPGHHVCGAGVPAGYTDTTVYTCTECGEKIYEYNKTSNPVTHFYFSFKLISQATANTRGKIAVQAYNVEGDEFIPAAEAYDLKTCELAIPAYLDDGQQYSVDTVNNKLRLYGKNAIGTFESGELSNLKACGLGSLNVIGLMNPIWDQIDFAEFQFDNVATEVAPSMSYRVLIRRGWTNPPEFTIKSDENVYEFKTTRSVGVELPEATIFGDKAKPGCHLAGYSVADDGTVDYAIGDIINIDLDRTQTFVFYGVWELD